MAARSTSGFICFSDPGHPHFLCIIVSLPPLLDEGSERKRKDEGNSRTLRSSLFKIRGYFLKLLDSISHSLTVRVSCKVFELGSKVVVDSGGTNEWRKLFRGRVVAGWENSSLFRICPIFFAIFRVFTGFVSTG